MARHRMREEGTIRCNGVCTFAERPDVAAPDARIIWRADLDPGTLEVTARPTHSDDPDGVEPYLLEPWLAIAIDRDGREHAVLSDGWHRIRLDVLAGSLAGSRAVALHYRLAGLASAGAKILPLRRFLDLCRHRRFTRSLFPPERRMARWLLVLRVNDALRAGASQRDIADVLFGKERVAREWYDPSDALRSQVRRLAGEARLMAAGRYRSLLNGRPRGS